ncbi:vacuolar protein sorting-associated protein vps17 [Grosmannia clavigera kw1407]|uniref:Vacuolar protein sorting-associated protein 17 n=1 Tax=Grosmannia clavigera (strain kw1407 / UAMH 11150) TaxID=655863 RepID=F0X8L4_GROCL|nr:vacuolar protein sorting-associated protein vps17 [Grosmannia clavigera kw1407]EFX05781.1 vacuolar protein sorting-associated protein vps17 [Grosmannia clavigera kw1407]
MDYSASINDSDNAGVDPWGSPEASPRRHQTGFRPASDPSQSPYQQPFDTAHIASGSDRSDAGIFGSDNPDYQRPETATSVRSNTNTYTDGSLAETLVGPGYDGDSAAQYNRQEQFQQLPPPQQQHQQYGQGPLPPQPNESSRFSSETATDPLVAAGPQRLPQPKYKLQAKITALERTGRKDPILRFDVHIRDIRRLHSEFEKLAEHLISANPEALVPAVPPALTSAGAGTEEDEARVKALMQRWLNYVCSNEVLMHDDEMVLFAESDFGYSPMHKKRQPATGVRRKILKQFAPPADDTPELQQARPAVKLFYLGTMDAGHKVDKLVKARRGLGLAESDFGVKLGAMNVQELHPGLANAYRKLGKVIQTAGDYQAAQATAEATTLGDPLAYHSTDALIFKETLTNRQLLVRELLQAQENSRSRLNAADRLKASSNVRREKVDEAIAAHADAHRHESELMQKTARVTHNLVYERRRWFARTSADLRLSIREFVIREIEAERRTLSLLETVRGDIRSIDNSGGLSRLNRESHPATVRRVNLASSQGPKGDAWSGVPRRSDALLGRGSVNTTTGDDGTEDFDGASGSVAGVAGSGLLKGLIGAVSEEEDDDRVDARNAASRLATSTF